MLALTRNSADPNDDGLPELPAHLVGQIVHFEVLYSAYPTLIEKEFRQKARIDRIADFTTSLLKLISDFKARWLMARVRVGQILTGFWQ